MESGRSGTLEITGLRGFSRSSGELQGWTWRIHKVSATGTLPSGKRTTAKAAKAGGKLMAFMQSLWPYRANLRRCPTGSGLGPGGCG